VLVKH